MSITIEFYTVAEACKLTDCNAKEIRKLRHDGDFPSSIRYRGKVLIPLIDLQPYIDAVNVPELAEYAVTKHKGTVHRLGIIKE